MKTFISHTLLLCLFVCFSQETKKNEVSIDKHVKDKTQDFNSVFAPLYYKKDTASYNELYTKSSENNYPLGEIIALNLKGTYYRDQSAYEKAILLHEKALQLAEDEKITDGILYSNNMLGVVYRRMDDVQKGMQYHFKALELAEQVETKKDFTIRNTAIAVNGIGNSYLILEQFESARKQFRRSYGIEKAIDNHLGLAINHQNIGYTYEKTNMLDSALYHYQASLKENNLIDSDVGRMICYNSISNVLLKQEKFNYALKYIKDAEKIASETGDNYYTASNYFIKGKTLMNLSRYNEAKEYLDRSLELSEQHNLMSNLADTYEALSDYYVTQNNYKKALECSKKSKDVESAYLNETNLKTKTNLEVSYDVEQKANQILNLQKEKDEIEIDNNRKQKTILYLLALFGALTLLGISLYQRQKLKKEKQVLEMEQKVLRTQMNPHFTFNALNSIKAYIVSEDTEKAVKYLNKFAKLIRNVLYSSNKRIITLREELDALESYVAIEQLRIKDRINLIIDIDGVDADTVEIPPLILQPYVENSLWHGLAKKIGEKKLMINVYKSRKHISIDVIDNGIGRAASALKNVNKSKHKSMGISISQKRLDNFFHLKSQDCSVTYTDLADEKGNASGTKVSLRIPV